MSEYISIQKAIEKITERALVTFSLDAGYEYYLGALNDIANDLRQMPTIDAVPAWIPVTERVPEPYSGEYLVTINDGSVYTDILWFDSPGDGRYESCFYKTDDDGYGVVCDDVIAWMPLPQPYKGEREDDEGLRKLMERME